MPAAQFVGQSGATDEKGGSAYGDWLYQGDWVTGQILEALERHGLANETLVIATSDNGAAGRAYAPLRASKGSIYEGGHRVPFLVRWPGKIRAGSVCDDTVSLNDLLATCADMVGAELPEDAAEDSVSILPALLGTSKGAVREATVHQAPGGDLAIRQGAWKLIFFGTGRRELYNLQDDLSETTNVAESYPEIVDRLTNLMRQYIASGRSTPGTAQKNSVAIVIDGKAKGEEKRKKTKKQKKDERKKKQSREETE